MEFTINFLHVCENAFFSDDNRLNLIKIFDTISAEKVKEKTSSQEEKIMPVALFCIALNFSGKLDEKSTAKMTIIDPQGKDLFQIPISTIRLKDPTPKSNTNFIINVQGLPVEVKGDYLFTIKDSNGKEISNVEKLISVK